MSRHNRERRERARAEVAALNAALNAAPRGPRRRWVPRWVLLTHFTGSFLLTAMLAGPAVFHVAVQPVLANLVYTPADGVVVGYGQRGGPFVDLLGGSHRPGLLASYEVGGQTYRCLGLPVGGHPVEKGDRVRVFHPAVAPDRGFVCDWDAERRWWSVVSPWVGLVLVYLIPTFSDSLC